MATAKTKAVRISENTDKPVLSKAQKKFNSLIKQIETQKQLLQEWDVVIPQYQQRIISEYQPLYDSYNDYRVELVHLFDAAYSNKLFKKTDKAKLKDIISNLTFELIQEHGREELKDLYNQYNEVDFDSENQQADMEVGNIMKDMMAEMFDLEFDDDIDVSSPEKLQAALQEKLFEREAQKNERAQKRKKSAKQLAKEAEKKQEEQSVSKSIQAVFRQLAAALHPDRELDENERERKTKLMQRVNIAYGKRDLLELLALQLETEQIDTHQLSNIAEARLTHFNKVLQEQLNELEQEIAQRELPFKMQLNVPPFMTLLPKQLLKQANQQYKELQDEIERLKRNLQDFQDPKVLKAALKSYRTYY
jgi:vacuolar-type H+-ATPase subunit I/STV1